MYSTLSSFRMRATSLSLEGHQGVVKTKERLRTEMDRDAKRRCLEYYGWLVAKDVPPQPSETNTFTQKPWEEVAVDFMGPSPFGEHLIVIVDYYSR